MIPKKDAKKEEQTRMAKIAGKILSWFHLSPLKIALIVIAFCVLGLRVNYQSQGTEAGQFDWVGRLENVFYDLRFVMRGPKKVSGKVGILAIDNESLARFGRWPLNRSVYEKPFENLKKRGVKWVGIDVLFPEAERALLEDSLPGIQDALSAGLQQNGLFNIEKFEEKFAPLMDASKGDKALANGFSKFENVIQSYFFYEKGSEIGIDADWGTEYDKVAGSAIEMVGMKKGVEKKISEYPKLMSHALTANIPTIAASSQYSAFTNNEARSFDGMVRANGLVKLIAPRDPKTKEFIREPKFFTNLSLALAANYLNRVPVMELDEAGVSKLQLMDAEGEKDPIDIPLVNNSRGWAYIKHYGPLATFPHISFVNVYDDKNLPEKLPEILFMGATATGTTDILASPFARDFYAVEHLAAMTENIIRQDFMRRPESALWWELGTLVISGIVFALILRKASALKSLFIVVAFMAIAFVIDRIYLFGRGYWFYLGTLYVQSAGIYVSVLVYKYFTEEREKKKVKNAFQHYLNPGVINQMLENPDMLKLGGEKKVLTVFFSDVRGFSTISETLSAEGLTHLLNEYFTPMTQLILDSGGMLDKYIGDAIMAVWGAPLPMADHADRAIASSLRMIDALEVLRAGWKERNMPMIDIGCGLNTGEMTVGNMGGDQRFDYTVMGDSVNLASRLEGTTKEYRTRIIISEYTKAAIQNPNLFVLRELDLIVVKGKTEPVKIYDVMHFPQQFRQRAEEIRGLFGEGLELYRAQNWDKAEERFNKILTLNEKDGPAAAFLDRCKYLREHSPGDNWNGVWVMKTK